jgi:hypothetical protein
MDPVCLSRLLWQRPISKVIKHANNRPNVKDKARVKKIDSALKFFDYHLSKSGKLLETLTYPSLSTIKSFPFTEKAYPSN